MKFSKLLRMFLADGWVKARQKGSHCFLWDPDTGEKYVIPLHKGRDADKRTKERALKKLEQVRAKRAKQHEEDGT